MIFRMRLACAALGLCAFSAAIPAMAQSQSSVTGRVVLVQEESILKLEDLDFGGIFGSAAGTVAMTATTAPTCTASGTLVHSGDCQPSEFIGKGQFNQVVRIRVKGPKNKPITLTGPGAAMRINPLVIDGGTDMVLDSAGGSFSLYRITNSTGFFVFRVAGTLNVGANQTPGMYTGTFEVQYNYD